jgi:hypothetical protein
MFIVDRFTSKWCFHKLAETMFKQSLNRMFSNKERCKKRVSFFVLKMYKFNSEIEAVEDSLQQNV